MSDPGAEGEREVIHTGAGLCDSCVHQQIVRNTRGSVFSLCRRSRSEPEYPRYPRIPVLSCPGYVPSQAFREPPSEPGEARGEVS